MPLASEGGLMMWGKRTPKYGPLLGGILYILCIVWLE